MLSGYFQIGRNFGFFLKMVNFLLKTPHHLDKEMIQKLKKKKDKENFTLHTKEDKMKLRAISLDR